VLVANGHVTAVDGATATVAIDKSFGAVQKDQLARIVSNAPKPKAQSSPSGTARSVAGPKEQTDEPYKQQRSPQATTAEVLPPTPPGYFSDYVGVVSKEVALEFNEQLAQFERETSNQVVVAIYRKMETRSDIADYTLRIAQAWKVGQADKNNGAVLFVFTDDRKMSIQVGYGLEGALPHETAFDITERHIKPHFRNADYEGGLREGVELMLQTIRGEYKGNAKAAATAPPEKRDLRSRLLGKWKGGRHTTLFRADGTFILDPDITPQPIRQSIDSWGVQGNQLIRTDVTGTHSSTIVSVTDRELVLRDANDTWHFKRVK
jgi:hypothetical protein